MSDIYDRAKWPPPEANPLVAMFQGGDDWIGNHELADALGLVNTTRGNKSVTGHYKDVLSYLGSDCSKLERQSFNGNRGTQERRFFSRKAVVLIAMRARTVNAAAFREWLATRVVEEV